jgi:hypothetical protein
MKFYTDQLINWNIIKSTTFKFTNEFIIIFNSTFDLNTDFEDQENKEILDYLINSESIKKIICLWFPFWFNYDENQLDYKYSVSEFLKESITFNNGKHIINSNIL